MTELFFSAFFISTSKLMGIYLSSNSVNIYREIMVCNSSISTFNSPQGFRESIDSSRRVDNYLCSVETESHPVKWMMPSIANIASNSSKLSFINWMSALSFHIIGWLIEVSNSRNMTLLLSSDNISMVVNIHWSVMQSFFIFLSLQNWSNYDNVMLFS